MEGGKNHRFHKSVDFIRWWRRAIAAREALGWDRKVPRMFWFGVDCFLSAEWNTLKKTVGFGGY